MQSTQNKIALVNNAAVVGQGDGLPSNSSLDAIERAFRVNFYELRNTSIKVNSVDPGYAATDLNQHRGTQSIPEGAAEIIRLAMLSDDGPTGTFSNAQGIVPW